MASPPELTPRVGNTKVVKRNNVGLVSTKWAPFVKASTWIVLLVKTAYKATMKLTLALRIVTKGFPSSRHRNDYKCETVATRKVDLSCSLCVRASAIFFVHLSFMRSTILVAVLIALMGVALSQDEQGVSSAEDVPTQAVFLLPSG